MSTRLESLVRLSKRHENLPIKTHSLFMPEALYQFSRLVRKFGVPRLGDLVLGFSFLAYQMHAFLVILRYRKSKIYHYRAGFGGISAKLAKKFKIRLVCDQSIAHPDSLAALGITKLSARGKLPWAERLIRRDIELADLVLVNSSYVKETCLEAGLSPDSIKVAQTPVPNWICDIIDIEQRKIHDVSTDVIFIGTFEHRKGADIFLEVAASPFSSFRDWKVFGELPKTSLYNQRSHNHGNVQFMGVIARNELIKVLARRPTVVFPTRAEGSSRAIAEALSAGCYVITTRECGSVIEDGKTGVIVGTNDSKSYLNALIDQDKLSNLEKLRVSNVTKEEVRTQLSEKTYLFRVLSDCYGFSNIKLEELST
jgi:glycosyltransferase involved in cell wall biosynthesis